MQFQFRDQPFSRGETTIGGSRVVNAILIADETAAEAAQVEELIPVGAVAGQTRDIVGKDDPDLLLVDQGNQFLKTEPALGRPAGAAEIRVDDPDLTSIPARRPGTMLEFILELKTLVIHRHLIEAGLSDVDDGQATQVNGLNSVGGDHGGLP